MRVSREQAARNREAILAQAALMLRERGAEGMGVVDVMAAAGFTHGGFYGHFGSKEELLGEACRRIFQDRARVVGEALQGEQDPLAVLAAQYLSLEHLAEPREGCPVPILSAEVGRFPGPLRQAFSEGLSAMIEGVAATLPEGSTEDRRGETIRALATMVGALSMARGVEDPELAKEILAAARAKFEPA